VAAPTGHAAPRLDTIAAMEEPTSRSGDPVVVVNPRASRVAREEQRRDVIRRIRDAVVGATGRPPRIVVGEDVAEADAAFVEAATEQARLVVVVGGDGTARDAAARLTRTGIPLAIVPAGTANLFAASIGIPLRIEGAIGAVSDGVPADLDLGRARWGTAPEGEGEPTSSDAAVSGGPAGQANGERIFVVAAGVGFDAELMDATTSELKQRYGRYGYFVAGMPALRHVSGFDCSLELGEERLQVRAIQVLAANCGEIIPGLLRPRRRINPRDGLLDVVVVLGHGLVDGTIGALEAIGRRDLGRSRSGRSIRARVRSVRVEAVRPIPVEVDGDVVGHRWLEADAIPQGIRVIVPRR
jgi:diacylglycerol kinase (ATP)